MNNFENNRKNKEEINLADWIRIFLKEKKLVFAFALSGLLLGGLLSFVLPVVYKAETFIETAEFVKSKSPTQLKEEIKAGFYGKSGGLKVSRPEGTNLIRVESSAKNPEEAIKILEDINNSVINSSERKKEARKKLLEENLNNFKKKIDFLMKRGREVEVLEAEIYKTKKEFSFPLAKIAKKPDIFAKKELSLKTGLLLGFFLGLFLSLIWVSIREWWRENKLQINKLE